MKTKILSGFMLTFALCFNAQATNGLVIGDLTKRQQDSIIFAFPYCTAGTVYFKDGSITNAKLNYNYYDPQVLFRNDKPDFPEDTLRRLDNLNNVQLITIGERMFVPVLSGLGEVILNNRIRLILNRKVNIEEKKTGAYGTGGSTSSIRSVSGINSNGTANGGYTGQTSFTNIEYDFASTSEISVDNRLFLMKDTKLVPLTKKNLLKLFPDATDFINRYLEEQKPALDDPEAMKIMVNLIYANGGGKK